MGKHKGNTPKKQQPPNSSIINVNKKLNIELLKEVPTLKLTSADRSDLFFRRLTCPIEGDLSHFYKIRDEYEEICKKRNLNFIQTIESTTSEELAYKVLHAITKMKILRRVWIGSHCVDLFIPALGYVIEIDGNVHSNEIKMKKDTLRDYNLQLLGLPVMSIKNPDVSGVTPKFIFDLQRQKEKYKKSSYQKRLMWREIYLLTIVSEKHFQRKYKEVQNEK